MRENEDEIKEGREKRRANLSANHQKRPAK